MQELSPAYLLEIARTIGNVSAFLGGFAATFIAALLSGKFESRAAVITIAMGTTAAVLLIVAVLATTMLVTILHPEVPTQVLESSSISFGRIIAFLSFILGIYLLLASLGVSGWIQSKTLGRITTIVSLIGFILVTMIITGF
jgi:hypothetical protein